MLFKGMLQLGTARGSRREGEGQGPCGPGCHQGQGWPGPCPLCKAHGDLLVGEGKSHCEQNPHPPPPPQISAWSDASSPFYSNASGHPSWGSPRRQQIDAGPHDEPLTAARRVPVAKTELRKRKTNLRV